MHEANSWKYDLVASISHQSLPSAQVSSCIYLGIRCYYVCVSVCVSVCVWMDLGSLCLLVVVAMGSILFRPLLGIAKVAIAAAAVRVVLRHPLRRHPHPLLLPQSLQLFRMEDIMSIYIILLQIPGLTFKIFM